MKIIEMAKSDIESTPIPPYLLFCRRRRLVDRLRWHAIALKWRQQKSLSWKIGYIALVVCWPALATFLSMREAWRTGGQVREMSGRPVFSQLLEQWALACWFGLPPHAYYNYGLFRRNRQIPARDYLHNSVMTALIVGLSPNANDSDFRDKVKFTQRCHDSDLPVIPILTVLKDGQFTAGTVQSAESLPEKDLFAKPVDRALGRGILAWTYERTGRYRSTDGTVQTGDDIFNTLRRLSHQFTYILQPRITNHSDLAKLTAGGLCTVRVVTGRDRAGQISILAAVYRMGRSGSLGDNFAAGGLAASIDLAEGRLSTAAGKAPASVRFTHHPDTGYPIAGIVIPDWEDVKRLCLRAHERISQFTIVGWDVAVTDQGAMLVEGNWKPGVEVIQKGYDLPATECPFSALILEHLESPQSSAMRPSIAT